MGIHIHSALCFSIWCLHEGFFLAVSVSIARTSKFSHLLRLADNFWWWVTIRVKRLYLGLVSASVSMWLVAPPHLILLLVSCFFFFFYLQQRSRAWACYWVRNGLSVLVSWIRIYDEIMTFRALRDWTIHSITKHEKHLTMITSSKQIVHSWASLSFLVAFLWY